MDFLLKVPFMKGDVSQMLAWKKQRGAGFSAQMMKRDPPGAQPERLLQSGVALVLTASWISCHLTEAKSCWVPESTCRRGYFMCTRPNSPVRGFTAPSWH